MRDLSGPAVAVLLASRRILLRDTTTSQKHQHHPRDTNNINNTHRTKTSTNGDLHQAPVLTLDRILGEYASSYRATASRYSPLWLRKGCHELITCGLLRPAPDHGGGGPWQYNHPLSYQLADENNNNGSTASTRSAKLPLQLTVDFHREIKQALESNVLTCSTALRQWGLKS